MNKYFLEVFKNPKKIANVKSSSGKNYSIPMCVHICLDFLKGSGTRFLLLVLSCPVYTEGREGVGEAGGEDEPD